MTEISYERNGKKYAATVEELPAASIAYLLQYGWAQSLQDSIAGRAKAVADEYREAERARLLEAGTDAGDVEAALAEYMSDYAVQIRNAADADLDGQLGKRADAIKAGTVGARVATPRDAFASMCKKIATEMLLAALKAKSTKRPKPDAFEALVGQVLEKHKDKIEIEARRRINAANAIGLDVDIEA